MGKKIAPERQQERKQALKEWLPTQSVWYEVEEGITQQSTWGEAQQHLQQVLVLVTVGLNWDQEQNEERSRTDKQSCSNSLWMELEEKTARHNEKGCMQLTS